MSKCQKISPGKSHLVCPTHGIFDERPFEWRFDRADEEIPLDNFWGKTENQVIQHLRKAANRFIGIPNGPSDVEIMVDVYYPSTIDSIDETIRGRAVHPLGRNRLMMDGHVQFKKDKRTK